VRPFADHPGPDHVSAIRIATRKSRLAIWQAEFVAERLRREHPGGTVELVPLSTRGDDIQDRPLAEIGGKGLFLKELEQALLDGRADIAVHSMKDVPAELVEGFALAAVLERGNPFDAFVSNDHSHFDALPRGARLGTSSLRRQCLARALRPDLEVVSLRGNVNTRLAKLDRGDFDAVLLAAAGLERLGMGDRIRAAMQPPDWLPAAGQGAMGIECRADDQESMALVEPLADRDATTCNRAERAVTRRLEGSCQVPIGAYATLESGELRLEALVGSADGRAMVRGSRAGPARDAERMGDDLGRELLERGGREILAELSGEDHGAAG